MIAPTHPPVALIVSAAAAGAGALIQQGAVMDPGSPAWWYREFGSLGLMLFAAYLMLRYFMTKVSEKDRLIKELTDQHRTTTENHTKVLLDHIREGHAVQREIAQTHFATAEKTAEAINKLSDAIERSDVQRRGR